MTETMTVEEYRDYLRGGPCKLPGPDATEAVWQARIEHLFTEEGWLVYHARKPRRDTAGFPDLVAVHPILGQVVAELKTRSNVSDEQQLWLDYFCGASVEVYLWRFPQDWGEAERVALGAHKEADK